MIKNKINHGFMYMKNFLPFCDIILLLSIFQTLMAYPIFFKLLQKNKRNKNKCERIKNYLSKERMNTN